MVELPRAQGGTRLGCIPDAPDDRDFRFEDSVLLGATPAITTAEIDLEALVPPIDNQGQQNCCAYATEAGVVGVTTGAGVDVTQFSPSGRFSVPFFYTNARLLEVPKGGKVELVDRGSSLRLMFKSVAPRTDGSRAGYGLVTREELPDVPENVNKIPYEDLYREGEGLIVTRYERIPDGMASPEGLRMALRRKHFPTIAMQWDEKAAQIGSRVYDSPGGTVYGGHALLVIGYSPILDAFKVRNSHGLDFGFRGHLWLASSFVASGTFDKWVFLMGPKRVHA